MKSTNPIWQHFHLLEENKKNILAYLEQYPDEILRKAQPGGWTMIQALRHVQLAEQGSIGYIKKKSNAGESLKKRTLKPRLLLVLTDWVFRLGLKIKAPAVLANPPITSLETLKSDWEATRAEIRRVIETYPDDWEEKAVYKHPFIGMLNLADAIGFFNVHQNHHIRQVHRIQKTLK